MGVSICSVADVLLERHPSSLLGQEKVSQPQGYEVRDRSCPFAAHLITLGLNDLSLSKE